MAQQLAPSPEGFNGLSLELCQMIALEVEHDKDICALRLVCRMIRDAIDDTEHSFWRSRFRQRYDFLPGLEFRSLADQQRKNECLALQYQIQSWILRRGTYYDFFTGDSRRERRVVFLLTDLINESFYGIDATGRNRSNNQDRLLEFVQDSRLLIQDRRPSDPRRFEPNFVHPGLAAVKLMCAHFLFCIEGLDDKVFALDEAQYAVYRSAVNEPMFYDDHQVNTNWLLQCMNFFRHYLLGADKLCTTFDELPAYQKPSPWTERLRDLQYSIPLSKHWKGTWARLSDEELDDIRGLEPCEMGRYIFDDLNITEDKILDLELNFLVPGEGMEWPTEWDKELISCVDTLDPWSVYDPHRRYVSPTPNQILNVESKSVRFVGKGLDDEDRFFTRGWLTPLSRQSYIPGWQRMTMMRHTNTDLAASVHEENHAYEGVVLPGGRMIIGRWWSTNENEYYSRKSCGPFILWAVEPTDPKATDTPSK
ncbi:hypothetical protein IQ07DRAFT_643897 [Pyrenochaeta sp. DS3sAY3a]|nr:hypothetical protein IQ07DRAFT_643897 [Pyrenochaeta sp. DS3sAY3a]